MMVIGWLDLQTFTVFILASLEPGSDDGVEERRRMEKTLEEGEDIVENW